MSMDQKLLFHELMRILTRLGFEIQNVPHASHSGACRAKGRPLFILNSRLPITSRNELIMRELACQDLSHVFVLPAVRREIEEMRSAGIPASGIRQ